jgi:hypothetical protein
LKGPYGPAWVRALEEEKHRLDTIPLVAPEGVRAVARTITSATDDTTIDDRTIEDYLNIYERFYHPNPVPHYMKGVIIPMREAKKRTKPYYVLNFPPLTRNQDPKIFVNKCLETIMSHDVPYETVTKFLLSPTNYQGQYQQRVKSACKTKGEPLYNVIAEHVREKEERLVTVIDFICKEFQMQSQQINVAIQDDLANLHFPKRASGSFAGAEATINEMDEIFERYTGLDETSIDQFKYQQLLRMVNEVHQPKTGGNSWRYLITEAMKDLQRESGCQDMTDQQQLDYILRRWSERDEDIEMANPRTVIAAQTTNTPILKQPSSPDYSVDSFSTMTSYSPPSNQSTPISLAHMAAADDPNLCPLCGISAHDVTSCPLSDKKYSTPEQPRISIYELAKMKPDTRQMILDVVFTRGYLRGNKTQQERVLKKISDIRTKWDANPRPNPNSVENQLQIDPSLAKYCPQPTHANPPPSIASSVSYYGPQSSVNNISSPYGSADSTPTRPIQHRTIDNSPAWMKVK